MKFWVAQDGCPSAPVIEQLPDLNTGDGTSTIVERYTGCRDGTVVELYRVIGGGHTWPSGPQYLPEKLIGKTCRDFDAADVIWKFFKLHPLKQ
ncbi:MAG: hypothetical protein EHM12_01685 [Dehalococcoidia bacterium]|nr:MAG: hypothetical protein EHM12_01685 [Dehalococcoidia bacterium]